MKSILSILIISFSFILFILGCTDSKTPNVKIKNAIPTIVPIVEKDMPAKEINTITDPRDGEVYDIVKIGKQIWLAENLRYDVSGSMINPDNPSKNYGRLYELISAQTACPNGWHLPSDSEWDELEMAHGMPNSFVGEGGWRGEHGTHMKSKNDWGDDGNGTDSLGFNVLPAGYYFSGNMGFEEGLEGLGYSAAFWSSVENNVGNARFLFSPREWVNKWNDTNNESGAALSCRCIKD